MKLYIFSDLPGDSITTALLLLDTAVFCLGTIVMFAGFRYVYVITIAYVIRTCDFGSYHNILVHFNDNDIDL